MALFIAWHHLRQHRYILILGLSFVAFGAGALSQILAIPRDIGLNAVISACLYTAAALGIIEACLARLDRRSGLRVTVPIATVIIALIVYYFYVDRNLLARNPSSLARKQIPLALGPAESRARPNSPCAQANYSRAQPDSTRA